MGGLCDDKMSWSCDGVEGSRRRNGSLKRFENFEYRGTLTRSHVGEVTWRRDERSCDGVEGSRRRKGSLKRFEFLSTEEP